MNMLDEPGFPYLDDIPRIARALAHEIVNNSQKGYFERLRLTLNEIKALTH
jgi:hypothetical protein